MTTIRQRAWATGVRFVLCDEVLLVADLVPQGRPNTAADSKTTLVCLHGDHDEPVEVTQAYECSDGHRSLMGVSSLGRARVVDGRQVLLSAADLVQVRTGGIAKNEINLRPHPRDQVEGVCRPAGKGYRLRLPDKAGSIEAGVYGVFAEIAKRPDVALVGEMRLRDHRGLYMLDVHRGQLVASEMIHPADLADVDVQDTPASERGLAMVNELVDGAVVDFDADEYRWDQVAAMAAAVENPTGVSPAAQAMEAADVFDLLEKKLEKSKRKPRAVKKAAAKKVAARKRPARRKTPAAS